MGEPPNWAALTEGLGKTWEVNDNSLKPYPAGFVIHPLLDCALDWRRQHPGAVVERVAVRGNPLLLQRTDRPEVATGRESQVSLQHAVAAALVLGKAGLDQFTDACVGDPAVKEMRRKVDVASDPAISTIAVEMDFWTTDGRKHSVSTQGRARQLGEPAEGLGNRAKAFGRSQELAAGPPHQAADRRGVGTRQERRRFESRRDDGTALKLKRRRPLQQQCHPERSENGGIAKGPSLRSG